MVSVHYGVPVEDWMDKVSKEKETVMYENSIKELSHIVHWDVRKVGIANSGSAIYESDDYIFEFIVCGRIRAVIYARRNDANTIDIITTKL